MCIECEEIKEMEDGKVRKVFTDHLPKKYGVGANKDKLVIDWNESIGKLVSFIYLDLTGELKIVNYDSKTRFLKIKYLNTDIFEINIDNFKKCKLGNLLNKFTKDFKISIGTRFKDDKRDLIIIDREYRKDKRGQNWKWYKYHCNVCGYDEGWILENNLLTYIGCSCCHGFATVEGINDIPTTNPWMIKYFQGGYNEAKAYSYGSNKKLHFICPDCGNIKSKEIKISDIYNQHSIGCPYCSDGQSYPSKLMFSVLKQLNINFETEFSPKWCKYIMNNKNKKGRYDFYFEINKVYKYIVEMDGSLGHGYTDNLMNDQTKEESQFIDDKKDRLAKENGIEVIRIDSQISDLEYIKNNILKSKLNDLFDLNKVNWNKVEEFALSNLVKKTCEIKHDNPNMTTSDIGKIMKLSNVTINGYLKKGTKIWDWINYNPKETIRESLNKGIEISKKPIKIFNKDGISLGIFESCSELSRRSEELFGVKLLISNISAACLGKRNHHKGFTFKYVDEININKSLNIGLLESTETNQTKLA